MAAGRTPRELHFRPSCTTCLEAPTHWVCFVRTLATSLTRLRECAWVMAYSHISDPRKPVIEINVNNCYLIERHMTQNDDK